MRRVVLIAATALSVLAVPAAAPADTVVVTAMNDSSADNGECSVREAVLATNSNASVNTGDCVHSGATGKDKIQLPDGTAAVSGAAGEDANASGDLDVEAGDGLTIVGEGQGLTKLDGDVDRVLDQRSGPLTLRKLTVQDGDAGAGQGGNVLDRANALLTLDRVTIRDGEADLGGGVRVVPGSELLMDRSVVTNNVADGAQGGAGIHAGTPVAITDSTISDNHATGSFGPGGMRIEGGPSTISNSTISGNSTDAGAGGAIEVTSSAMGARDLAIVDTVVTDNHANGYRGGGVFYGGQGVLEVTRSLFTLNTAESGGGAIETSNDPDTLKLSRSIVTSNALSSSSVEIIGGAGISADGKSTISKSEIGGNVSASPNDMAIGFGGAIRNGGQMRISRSTLFLNGSPDGFGGAVYQSDPGSELTLSNATVSENSASSSGGAIFSALSAEVRVYSSTFAANTAGSDGDAVYASGTGIADLRGSIFDNGPDACEGGGILASKGFNADSGSSCAIGGPHDRAAVDPKLGIFDNYGGPIAGADGIATELHLFPIKKSSPAKDLIPKKKCKDDKGKLKTDERGHERPSGKKCDAGAFER